MQKPCIVLCAISFLAQNRTPLMPCSIMLLKKCSLLTEKYFKILIARLCVMGIFCRGKTMHPIKVEFQRESQLIDLKWLTLLLFIGRCWKDYYYTVHCSCIGEEWVILYQWILYWRSEARWQKNGLWCGPAVYETKRTSSKEEVHISNVKNYDLR